MRPALEMVERLAEQAWGESAPAPLDAGAVWRRIGPGRPRPAGDGAFPPVGWMVGAGVAACAAAGVAVALGLRAWAELESPLAALASFSDVLS